MQLELSQLESLPTPEGADETVFGALKAELARVLSAQGVERFLSTPPTDANSACPLCWDSDGGALSWEYYCTGDYDQNSEVNIADLTPLGQNIGAVGPFDPSSQLSVIDGDSNGELNIADVTAIGQNYLNSVTGYNIYASDSLSDYPVDAADGNGGATQLGTVAFSAGQAAAGQRTQFSFTMSSPQLGTYLWVRPTDGTSEGTPSEWVEITSVPNDSP